MIKAIMFDCFGVLVGSGFWSVYESLGGDLEADKEFIDEWLNKLNSGQVRSDVFKHKMAERLGVSFEVFEQAFVDDEQPNEQLFDFINSELRPKYKLALVSNATGESIRRHISADKLNLFDELIISGEVELLKPDPKFFQLAIDRLGTKPEEAIFVDDNEPYVIGGQRFGFSTIQYKSFSDFKKQLDSLV